MPQKLRIIYLGTPEFAVPSLEILIQNGFEVVAVVTAPDKPAGRGMALQISDVKKCALQYNLPILQPSQLKEESFLEELRSYKADLQVVVAFRMLPEAVWQMPHLGTINVHASLLPQYRGAAPINWAIINGEKQTGVTTFFLKHEIDTGDLLFQDIEPIHENDKVGDLYERLKHKGAQLLLRTVQAIENQDYTPQAQAVPPNQVLHKAPKIFTETCQIDWQKTPLALYNFVRGLSPYPAAWTEIGGKKAKIFAIKIVETTERGEIGNMETDGKTYLHFWVRGGKIAIEELQMEGRKRIRTEEFLRGTKL